MKSKVLIYIPVKYQDIRGGYISPVLQSSRYDKYVPCFVFTNFNAIVDIVKEKNFFYQIIELDGFQTNFTSSKKKLFKYALMLPKLILHIAKLIRYVYKENFEIIHVHNLEGLLICKFVSIFTRKKVIMHIRDNASFEKPIWKIAVNLSNGVIVVSDSLFTALINKQPSINLNNIYIVANGAIKPSEKNVNLLEIKFNKYSGSFKIGLFGAIEKRKGQLEFIVNIMYKLPNEFELFLVGGINDQDYYIQLFKFLEDNQISNVHLIGFEKNMTDWYHFVDLVVSYSTQEGMPRVLLEAMSFHKAIIASDVIGNRDVIVDGFNGYLIQREEYNSFIDTIKKVNADSDLKNTLGKNGGILFDEKYEISISAKKIEAIYDKLI